MHNFFEEMRRANLDFYTASPFEAMDDDQLEKLASEAGMTVEELRQHIGKAHIEMTCPLCGQPSTHLVNCKGCGGDAWGSEYLMAYGDTVHQRLKAAFRQALTNEAHQAELGEGMPEISLEQVNYATTHAYAWGGCMICATCWNHTLPVEAFRTCPIRLLGEQSINDAPGGVFVEVLLQFPAEDKEAHQQKIRDWIKNVWSYWTVIWNTVEYRAYLEDPQSLAQICA